jgi:hypothetical protein
MELGDLIADVPKLLAEFLMECVVQVFGIEAMFVREYLFDSRCTYFLIPPFLI